MSFDAVMHRYGIRSVEELLSTWNRAQFLLAVDAMFWANPKECKDFGPVPRIGAGRRMSAAEWLQSFMGDA